MGKSRIYRWRQVSRLVLGAIGLSVALSGCVIEPLYGPHHYHPYHYGYGGY